MYDLEEIKWVVKDVIEESGPDFVYEACPVMLYSYSHVEDPANTNPTNYTFVPGCIVGQVLAKLGWKPNGLSYGTWMLAKGDLLAATGEDGITMTEAAAYYLDTLQRLQDKRIAWGSAAQLAFDITNQYLNDGKIKNY